MHEYLLEDLPNSWVPGGLVGRCRKVIDARSAEGWRLMQCCTRQQTLGRTTHVMLFFEREASPPR
jgi:hypothetical protein